MWTLACCPICRPLIRTPPDETVASVMPLRPTPTVQAFLPCFDGCGNVLDYFAPVSSCSRLQSGRFTNGAPRLLLNPQVAHEASKYFSSRLSFPGYEAAGLCVRPSYSNKPRLRHLVTSALQILFNETAGLVPLHLAAQGCHTDVFSRFPLQAGYDSSWQQHISTLLSHLFK